MRTHEPTAFNLLLEAYCRSIGMGDVEIGPEGGIFEIGDVEVAVQHDDEFERLSMMTVVETVPVERLPQLAPQLLQLNAALALSGGHAFCADIESGELRLYISLALNNTTSEDIDEELAALVAKCRAARELLGAMNEADNLLQAAASEETKESEDGMVKFKG
ncbi:MAG: CesT family type III secretion system chaperone [Methylocystis sp.]|uniref:CesT family type III secretion system chaperone n=1 Tax=Methylocystis sp. TaxID=1911079 RepID=UPI003DA4BEAF